MNHCPPGPQVFNWGRFKFFRKFAEIFANECLSPVSTAINLLLVSMTPVNNPYHRFLMIAGVVDTGNKFIDTGEKILPVTMTPVINLLPVTRPRTLWRWGAAKDRRKLKETNR
jgi:hypothetical protein